MTPVRSLPSTSGTDRRRSPRMKHSRVPHFVVAATAAATAAFFCSCAQTHATPHKSVSIPQPAPTADKPVELAGLHNVVTYVPGVVGGGQPEGHEGLETLAAMGI